MAYACVYFRISVSVPCISISTHLDCLHFLGYLLDVFTKLKSVARVFLRGANLRVLTHLEYGNTRGHKAI